MLSDEDLEASSSSLRLPKTDFSKVTEEISSIGRSSGIDYDIGLHYIILTAI
jgi:hypothetical protein